MKTFQIGSVVAGALLAALFSPVRASVFTDIRDGITAPVRIPAQVITGQQSVRQGVGNFGATIQGGANVYGQLNNFVPNMMGNAAGGIAGTPGRALVDAATFAQRFQHNLEQAAANATGRALQGQNPLEGIASPLAAALRSAYEQHKPNAKPLPDHVKLALSRVFKPAYLENVRYAIGSVEISVPNGINGFKRVFNGVNHAVTVNNLIIFNSEPGANYAWWGHEVQHTIQYLRLGFEGFAYQYLVNYRRLEAEADMIGQQVQLSLMAPPPRPAYVSYYRPPGRRY